MGPFIQGKKGLLMIQTLKCEVSHPKGADVHPDARSEDNVEAAVPPSSYSQTSRRRSCGN